ncbi:GIY-YIG nuclease family protein [Flagellimonas abyssi]|uniref:GIY-YIG nuclease family protein n=1 Tax=Flagellimonas abyssi TaxID=2864871 RepID=A0ABS7ESX0_9FLAO|nr:GIY-YIG nuclease family protein [Allomuricauda abyssi]MBW8200119.1 GIY-YIG nuclease family protein [Allomuricauda abyssi]|tara:strand:- start:220 stop:534 length:315 start_codon:yes stop_codon:yes gene_type:complete
MKGYVYILKCSDGSFYTGSTIDLDKRLKEHQYGRGANHTKKRLPVEWLYVEEYLSIAKAFEREKQVQGWSRLKKKALITGEFDALPNLSECKNETNFRYYKEKK